MLEQVIRCDLCGAQKRQANHWFVAYEESGELRISGWNSLHLQSAETKHLCGEACAHKLISHFLMKLMDSGTQRAADMGKRAPAPGGTIDGASAMSEELNHSLAINNIAIATDFSPWSNAAMQHAMLIARWYGATLHIVHTVRRSEFAFVPDLMVQLDQLAERDCQDLMRRLNAGHKLDDVTHRLWNLYGEVSTFGDFVVDQKIDLLVLGTRGRSGISKLLLGSVAEEIFHCVSCPVLTVGPWSRGAASRLELKSVLLATDLSPQSAAALPYVLSAAKGWRTTIDVLHVSSPGSPDCESRIEAYRRRLDALSASQTWLSIRYHAVHGAPSQAVLDFASQTKQGLIVLGLDNHRSLYEGPRLSHAYEIVRQARCPVLSVRSDSRIEPQN